MKGGRRTATSSTIAATSMDPILSQAVRDLHETLRDSERQARERKTVAHRFINKMRNVAYGIYQDQPGHLVPGRYWKNGHVIADPSHDDR